MSGSDRGTASLGRWFFVWAILIAALVWFLDGQLDQQRNPNHKPTSEVVGDERIVRLQRNRSGQYHVLASVNGEPVEFLVDTGASGVILPADFAERHGARAVAVGLLDAAGGGGGLARRLGGELLAGRLAAGALASGLLGTGHL